MKLLNVHLDGTLLTVQISPESRQEAQKFVYGFKPGDYEIVKAKKKRSLDANAYCWSLCQQIGQAVGISKDEVYRRALRDGNAFEILAIQQDAVDGFARHWQSNGIGWFVVIQNTRNGTTFVQAYYGSSVFDTAEMSALIDDLLQEAESIGLDVASDQVKSLLEDWDNAR